MITCPCGMTVDDKTAAWPPYRTTTTVGGEITFAICIHGVVVIDKREEGFEKYRHRADWWNDFGGE